MKNQWVEFTATFAYVGRVPKAPGTFGSLAAVPLALLLQMGGDVFYMVFTLLLAAVAIWVAQAYETKFQTHDPKEIVIDEVVGVLIAFTMLSTWSALLAAFVLFRLFDILKPFPVGWADKKLEGGLGVVADDILAGVLASLIMQALTQYTHWFEYF